MKNQLLTLITLVCTYAVHGQMDHQRVYSTFDNMPLAKADTFNNGADSSLGFHHYGRYWNNSYNADWGSWSGWSLSNMTDDTTAGYLNQYSAKPGHGVSFTSNYMVASGNESYIKLDAATEISGAYITNSTYAYFDLKNGSGFSKAFGGTSGDDPDYFKLIIKGYNGSVEVSTVDFYLADYRDADNSKDYIIDDWTFVDFDGDLYSSPKVDSIVFRYESSDVGMNGMNTPATFCMDDLNAVPNFLVASNEWDAINNTGIKDTFYNGSDNAGGINAGYLFFNNNYNPDWSSWNGWSLSGMFDDTTSGFENQFSCINNQKSQFYLAGGQHTEIRSPYLEDDNNFLFKTRAPAPWALKFSVTNSTYVALDMEQGSSFSKKFGGADGNDPDYYRLHINYVDASDSILRVDTVYLADFRFDDNSKDYILKDWKTVKEFHSESIRFHKIVFELESSDVGTSGINTPAYFCLSYEFLVGTVPKVEDALNVLLYPNPASNLLKIQSEEVIEQVDIFGLDGRLLMPSLSQEFSKNITINTTELMSGLYFAIVKTSKGTATKRFVKQ